LQNMASAGFSCWHFGHFMFNALRACNIKKKNGKDTKRVDQVEEL
jgi:hypothetical protein